MKKLVFLAIILLSLQSFAQEFKREYRSKGKTTVTFNYNGTENIRVEGFNNTVTLIKIAGKKFKNNKKLQYASYILENNNIQILVVLKENKLKIITEDNEIEYYEID